MSNIKHEEEWPRARAGDGEAFGRIFDDSSSRVFQHARRLVESRVDAEDITATVFLEMWRRRDAVRLVEGSVLPWLLATATNLALNQRRGLRRYRAFLSRLPRTESTERSAEQTVLGSPDYDIDKDLLAALRALSPIDQQLVALISLEDYTLRSAAEVLGITETAARSRWQRIRRRLTDHAPDRAFVAQLGETQ